MLVLDLPAPADHLRPGVARPTKTGRAARTRVGRYDSRARRRAVLEALAVRWNQAQYEAGRTTAARFLADELRAEAGFIASYASWFGKHARAAYLALFEAEPASTGLMVIGNVRLRLQAIHSYLAAETAALVDAAFTYLRTAALLGA